MNALTQQVVFQKVWPPKDMSWSHGRVQDPHGTYWHFPTNCLGMVQPLEGQAVMVAYTQGRNGKFYIDAVNGQSLQAQPQQYQPSPAQQTQPAFDQHAAGLRRQATQQPSQGTAQGGPAQMPFKDYSIAMQAFAKAFSSQLSAADPQETIRQLHELVCCHHDAYGRYQRGETYNPRGVAPSWDESRGEEKPVGLSAQGAAGLPGPGHNPQAHTLSAQALNDEIPDWVSE